jgi:hypothetical protein
MKYRMTELMVTAIGRPQADSTAATPSPTTYGELTQALDNVPRQSPMPQVTSRQGIIQKLLGSDQTQVDNRIVLPMPTAVSDLSKIELVKPVQPITFTVAYSVPS